MRHFSLSVLGATLFAVAVAAQGSIVSPVGAATVEGNSTNGFPFASIGARRYMQIHADLGSTPLLITQLSFRMNAGIITYTATRTLDLELFLGDGVSQSTPNLAFDSNYVGARTSVIGRSIITWGPQGQAVAPGPNAFTSNMDLTLPAPFLYAGTHPLVWEVAFHGYTNAGTFSGLDADLSSSQTSITSVSGNGCIATGQTTPMLHSYQVIDTAGTLIMNGEIVYTPANSLAIMCIGFSNPYLTIPGLCSRVYTDAMITQVLGFTTATGTFTADTPTGAIVVPNVLVGLPIHTQAFVVDTGIPFAIQFACSNGQRAVVPAPQLGHVNRVTRLWNSVGGTTATHAICLPTTMVGFGLVTRFSFL